MKRNIKATNQLIHESSPYLLQHAHNPVNWLPWGDAAFTKAKEANKLVLISIGYAACHWCHVMEKESFENEQIAKLMNDNFICIKVDREERPDVDQFYMSAVQLINGQGGWPLNCFALPDRRPVFGGTYFRPADWEQVLTGLATTFKNDQSRVFKAAHEITEGVRSHEIISFKHTRKSFSPELLTKAVESWKSQFDVKWGGNKGAPKFPMPSTLEFLLHYHYIEKDDEVETHLKKTLNKMAQGGIFDHVGGGFARYSVDGYWKVPHFEKMLYDNAQLVSVYAKAALHFETEKYLNVVEKTLEFIEHELTNNEGFFYSSLDADSEGEEGKFYVWDFYEIEKVLEHDAEWFTDYFNIYPTGNWEGTNILWKTEPQNLVDKFKLKPNDIEQALNKLYVFRENRVRPALDNKVLTSWNALMDIGYIDAFRATGKIEYLDIALKNAGLLKSKMLNNDYSLMRSYKNGKAAIHAFLDDYAFVIQLFIELFQITTKPEWLVLAEKLTSYVIKHFYDNESGMFFYTNAKYNQLISRKMELSDNVIPSSNAVMAQNLSVLSKLTDNVTWDEISEQMLYNVSKQIKTNLPFFAYWGKVQATKTWPQLEVVVAGEKALVISQQLQHSYTPGAIFIASGSEQGHPVAHFFKNRFKANDTLIYVCYDKQCKLPVNSIELAQKLIQNI